MSKGVILIAAGHPYYGNFANQLCRSVKASSPGIDVAVATIDGALSHCAIHSFDKIIDIPREYVTTKGQPDYVKAKAYLYELSPFTETIFIDSDVIWLPQKPVTDLFEMFKDIPFTMANRGAQEIGKAKEGFIHWCSPKTLIEKYGFKPDTMLFNAASEFIYFKKCKEVKALFKEAQKVYADPPKGFKMFAFHLPDELAFEIAMMKTGLHPHVAPFIPFYWEQFERRQLPVYDMYKQYYAYSMGGNTNTGNTAQIYNNLAQHYNKKFGVSGYFPAKNKSGFLPERKHI